MTDPIRVAVAGLGAVAQAVHLPLIARRWDLFELTAVCELSPSLRDAVGEQYGVPAGQRFGDGEEMLSKADADGVLLLTSGSHAPAARYALGQGLAVFCEKPLAYTVAETDQLAEAADANRPALLLAYMKERDDAVVRMRELLDDVDSVRAVEVRVLHPSGASQLEFAHLRPVPTDVPADTLGELRAQEESLLDAALGAGTPRRFRQLYAQVVLGSIVHDTSLLRTLFGGLAEVDDVRAWPDDAFPPSVEVTGVLPGGVRTTLAWHYLEDYPTYRETFTVHHTRGSIQVTFATPYLLNGLTELEVVEAGPAGEIRSTYRSTGSSFENELVEFHRMVTEGTPPMSGVAEGRADIITSQRIMRRLAERAGIPVGGEAALR